MTYTNTKTKNIVYAGMFTALMAVGAFIKIMIPVGPFMVTFSLQFFFALLAGLLLGAENGFFSVLAYLVIGLCGVPVFAHGGGPAYLLKPTFGFLIGFAAAAFVAGTVIKYLRKRTFQAYLLASFCGEIVYYLCGLVYYFVMFNYILAGDAETIGVTELIEVWLLSTVVPDFVLCILASMMACRVFLLFEGGSGR